jgi:aminomethyltransferase
MDCRPLRSPLHAIQERSGGRFIEWQGGLWANDFGDPVAEHRAVRTSVGVWDISLLRRWDFRGAAAAVALDRLFTNEVTSTEPGQIRYGVFCDETGAIVNDGTAYRLAADHFWVFTSRETDLQHFRRHTRAGPGEIAATGDSPAVIQLQGPRSREVLTSLCPTTAGLGYFRFQTAPVPVAGTPCWVSRIGYSGELGYELLCEPAAAEMLWETLTAAGARPYGFSAVNTLRIEAGLVLLDADFRSGRTTPYDVSLDHVVRLDKGEFLGRDALAKIAAAPPRRLVTLLLDGDRVPSSEARVTRDGRVAGTITSACHAPTIGGVVALASVERDLAGAGQRLQAHVDGQEVAAEVGPVPIYDPEKRRPRG